MCPSAVPSVRTVNRILIRRGLLTERPRKRRGSCIGAFERRGRAVVQIDMSVGWAGRPAHGGLREAKVVTGWMTIPGTA